MKLSKTKLIKLVKSGLEELGFKEFKNTIDGSQGFFVKKLGNSLYLSLGLTIHRYFDSAFTGDYYLSKTTRWGTCWGDIPNKCYERASFLLTEEERSNYIIDKINIKGTYDIWWYGNDEKSIFDFLNTIKLTEPRFINQSELIKQIDNSNDLNELSLCSKKVKELVTMNNFNNIFRFLPNKEIDGIPMIWFMASENAIIECNGILNSNTVKLLAADAYRQFILDQKYPVPRSV